MKAASVLSVSLLTLVFFANTGQAQEDTSLSQFTLGDHLSGAEVDLSALDGKVVVIEKWGTR